KQEGGSGPRRGSQSVRSIFVDAEHASRCDTTNVQLAVLRRFTEGRLQSITERRVPIALKRKDASQNPVGYLRFVNPIYVRHWKAGAVQGPYASDLVCRVRDLISVEALLGFEHRINAFRRDDGLSAKTEVERGVLAIEHHDVHLMAECTL